jgi:hypothetical protein
MKSNANTSPAPKAINFPCPFLSSAPPQITDINQSTGIAYNILKNAPVSGPSPEMAYSIGANEIAVAPANAIPIKLLTE